MAARRVRPAKLSLFDFFTGRNTAALNADVMEARELHEHLLLLGGPDERTKSGLDLKAAAEVVGVSRRTLERYLAGDRHPSPAVADKIRVASRKVAGQGEGIRDAGEVTSLLETIGGRSEHSKSGIKRREAARRLKVSEGTVRRWVNQGKVPQEATAAKLRQQARRMTNTKRGRQAATRQMAASGTFNRPMRVDVIANQGPRGHGQGDYKRDRRTYFDLSADEAQDFFQSYIDGGDQAAQSFAEQLLSERYVEDWQIDDFNVVDGGFSIRPR